MSTIVPMPVRVKPPPAEIGEIISPGCADLATTMPGEGRPDHRVVELHAGHAHGLLGHADLLLRAAELGSQRVALGAGGVHRLLADQLPPQQLLLPREVALGLIELGPDLGHLRARRGELGPGQRERGLGLGVVEPGQDVALLDPHAFLDRHLGHLAGDLRGDRGLAAGGHVAAGVQHGPRALAGRPRHRGLHRRWRRPDGEPQSGRRRAREPPAASRRQPGARAAAGAIAVDPQLLEQLRLRLSPCALGSAIHSVCHGGAARGSAARPSRRAGGSSRAWQPDVWGRSDE